MGQVNVNTPSGSDPDSSSGSGFILGIIVAIIVIAALVYFLVLAPGGGNNDGGTDGGGVDASEPADVPAPSGWKLINLA
ncbi:MAG: hypothetical protein H0W10_03985 [Chloroflexi bacterium]|nr:hypothetical protein [Chloroflexota bacterium]